MIFLPNNFLCSRLGNVENFLAAKGQTVKKGLDIKETDDDQITRFLKMLLVITTTLNLLLTDSNIIISLINYYALQIVGAHSL